MCHRSLFKQLSLALSATMLIGPSLLATPLPTDSTLKTMTSTGTFEITLTPHSEDEFEAGRMTIDKIYTGEFTGTGKGQMLSVRTATAGSASYVALESVTGTLDGQKGSFTLRHVGSMVRGDSKLEVQIVPDSGTEELTGISGSMEIEKVDGKHSYTLTYSLAK